MTESQQRGRLAQMIETRGGLAPPEAPFVIEHREALIYMLCEASEVEHGEIVPRGQDFATVGHLYRSIEQGFADLAAKLGEEQLFAGPPQAQATEADFGWPELVAVTDLASAQRAIDEILEQGEGPRGHWKDAHFGQFVDILDEYVALREANPAF